MNEQNLELELKKLLVERLFLDVSPEEIQDDTDLSEYGVDSFLLLELIVAMEEMFAVRFAKGDITVSALKTVSGLAEVIRRKKEQQ